MHRLIGLATIALLAGCGDPPAVKDGRLPDANRAKLAVSTGGVRAPETAPAPVSSNADADDAALVGTWTGPEGLSFVVEPVGDGRYRVRNRDTLDEQTTFVATRSGRTLRFERRGEMLVARLGTGEETGFKWLLQKRDCLIVRPGIEGYCRD